MHEYAHLHIKCSFALLSLSLSSAKKFREKRRFIYSVDGCLNRMRRAVRRSSRTAGETAMRSLVGWNRTVLRTTSKPLLE